MNNDFATLAGEPKPLVIEGETYLVYPLTFDDLAELQRWLEAQFPDPFDAAHRAIASELFSVAQQKHILDAAVREASRPRPRLGSAEANELVDSREGIATILYLTIRRGRDGFTPADADALLAKLSAAHLRAVMKASDAEIVTGPKARTGDGPTSGPTAEPPGSTPGPSTTA